MSKGARAMEWTIEALPSGSTGATVSDFSPQGGIEETGHRLGDDGDDVTQTRDPFGGAFPFHSGSG